MQKNSKKPCNLTHALIEVVSRCLRCLRECVLCVLTQFSWVQFFYLHVVFFLQIKSCISKCEVPLCPNCSLICQLPWNKFALFKTSIWEEQTLLTFTLILKFSQENIQVLENRNTCNRLGNKFSSWKFVVNQSLIRWKMLVKWAVTGLAV